MAKKDFLSTPAIMPFTLHTILNTTKVDSQKLELSVAGARLEGSFSTQSSCPDMSCQAMQPVVATE